VRPASRRQRLGVERGQAGEVVLELALQRLVQLPARLGLLQQHVGQVGFGLALHVGALRQLLPPGDQEIGLLLARLAAGLQCLPRLLGLIAVVGHFRERNLEAEFHLVGVGETAVAAGAFLGEELRVGRDRRQAVVLLGVGHLALQLQVATEIQGAPGLFQVRLGALGPALGGALGHFLKLVFAFGQLLLGRGADLLAGAWTMIGAPPSKAEANRV